MLHITNGDSAIHGLRQAGLAGDFLAWQDVLHEGPVPAGLTPAGLRTERARFLASTGWVTEEMAGAELAARDRQVDEAAADPDAELVLWFEHDLYDQLQLLQLLDRLAGARSRVTLVCDAEYLGWSTPERLAERFPDRRTLEPDDFRYAGIAWRAFGDSDPRAISALPPPATPALRFVPPALRRLLQQYPAVGSGLSRSESQLLSLLAAGDSALGRLFKVSQEQEEAVFLGDSVFARYLAGLSDVPHPLLLFEEGEPIRSGMDGQPGVWQRKARLTATGREVLAGRADHVGLNGIDRWLGGVHLAGRAVRWRWDPAAGAVVEVRSEK